MTEQSLLRVIIISQSGGAGALHNRLNWQVSGRRTSKDMNLNGTTGKYAKLTRHEFGQGVTSLAWRILRNPRVMAAVAISL